MHKFDLQVFDLVIIGGGPAGYTAAIRASQLGMKVACIEKNDTLGGTCLNVGCIPSKALLHFSEQYANARENFSDIGIKASVSLNLEQMIAKKDQIVNDLCKGISTLFIKNKVTKIHGHGKIIAEDTIEVKDDTTNFKVKAKNILIATGSNIVEVPKVEIDESIIVSSTGALSLKQVPKDMVVIGGGYIGLELGSVWQRLGSNVTVVEYANRIVPALDLEIGAQFAKILQKQGIQFHLNTKVLSAEKTLKGGVTLAIQQIDSNKIDNITTDIVLVAVGRKPNTQNIYSDSLGIVTDARGCIQVNNKFQTNISNIYAIGDVITGPMLAHKAEEEAVATVEIIAGQYGHVNYDIIPSVVYTNPEVASVGRTEEEIKQAGIDYKIGKFPFLANSRARAVGCTDGMVKIIADSKTDEVLGVHIIGHDAGTLIAEVAAFMTFRASSEDIARTCHAHPTLNETIKEAALAVDKRTINI